MKKAIALFLSMTMLLSLALVPAHAEDASSVELDLAQGSIVISATGYAQDGGAETPYRLMILGGSKNRMMTTTRMASKSLFGLP